MSADFTNVECDTCFTKFKRRKMNIAQYYASDSRMLKCYKCFIEFIYSELSIKNKKIEIPTIYLVDDSGKHGDNSYGFKDVDIIYDIIRYRFDLDNETLKDLKNKLNLYAVASCI